jgi:hypothetical protein
VGFDTIPGTTGCFGAPAGKTCFVGTIHVGRAPQDYNPPHAQPTARLTWWAGLLTWQPGRKVGGGGNSELKVLRSAIGDLPTEARNSLSRPAFAEATADNLRMAPERRLVEAAGVEPASESTSPQDSTCVSASEISCPA